LTGVDWWDSFAGPLRKGNVYIIAGYPGAGKTTLALNLAWSMALAGRKVWYYCLELDPEEVFEVLAGHILKDASVTEDMMAQAYAIVAPTGFRFYQPCGYMGWEEHLRSIGKAVSGSGIEVLFIDNLSFLTRVKSNTFEAENVVSAKIKSLAQQLRIPIVVLHHLRKPGDDQTEPEPNVHSMKGSGAILADASDAFILHHPMLDNGFNTRHPVGYLLSGKPRWGTGGKRYVRLEGSQRTYFPAGASEYSGKKRRQKYE
jgi:replicative DNA helicase